jgi:hypothetical protein
MPQMDVALFAIARPAAHASSTGGALPQLATSALLGLGHAPRAPVIMPGDTGPVSRSEGRPWAG